MNIELSDANYIEIVAGIIGIAFIIAGNAFSTKRKKLISSGIRVEGVVYAMEQETSRNHGAYKILYSPIIRFVTTEKEWVTEKYLFGVSSKHTLINPSYREGDKVTVIYEPGNVKNFIIDDFNAKAVSPLFIILGTLVIISSILHYVYQSGFHF
ncbi:DUF3592 domain-containing protein [Mucilaginibacter aquariorum]|uniref:DUF3592 domain-containing protein n=1 Tax=Mucilaginibacter aquariorum TaxID=2967225 RepID=A0ABT1SWI6_9SPHI|nr:DUF3592 domain-containing protein [Mucilaginibacter aquariorum]MCQ6956714.1 DUF3592 domain-containing protein [Mucilaginibacter aquariorum]